MDANHSIRGPSTPSQATISIRPSSPYNHVAPTQVKAQIFGRKVVALLGGCLFAAYPLSSKLFEYCSKSDSAVCQPLYPLHFSNLLSRNSTGAANFAASCLSRENQGCQRVVSSALPALMQNPANAFPFAKECAGHANPSCPQILSDAFTSFLDNGSSFASPLAQACAGKEDTGCQTLLDKAFERLLEQDPKTSLFKTNRAAAFDFATSCIGKNDPACQKVVRQAFPSFLELDATLASNFAQECVKHTDIASQEIVKSAYPALKGKDSYQALKFLLACTGSGNVECQNVVGSAFPKLDNASFQAQILEKCLETQNTFWSDFIISGFKSLLQKDKNQALLLAKKCGDEDKDGTACTTIIVAAHETLQNEQTKVLLANLRNSCKDKKTAPCQSLKEKELKRIVNIDQKALKSDNPKEATIAALEVFDLTLEANCSDAMKGYRQLSLEVHHDKNKNTPELAQQAFLVIGRAHEVLQNGVLQNKKGPCAPGRSPKLAISQFFS